jgi:hypothetical protein
VKTQQYRLYASEQTTTLGPDLTLDEIRALINRLRESWWWERNCADVLQVQVYRDKRMGYLGCGGLDRAARVGVMCFSRDLIPTQYVLHELAHVLAKARFHSQSHDPWFARIYLELVYLVRGPKAWQALQEAFIRDDVDFDAQGVVDSGAVAV